jgi:hypothetical protein
MIVNNRKDQLAVIAGMPGEAVREKFERKLLRSANYIID